jgi:hypothetical protein
MVTPGEPLRDEGHGHDGYISRFLKQIITVKKPDRSTFLKRIFPGSRKRKEI